MASALQSLGLSLPQPAGAAPQAANSADSSSANSQDADGRSKTGDDMRTMMHALFEAVRSGQAAGSVATTGSDSTSAAAASGANPSLQDFLDKLQANLGYTSTSGTGNGSLVSTQA